MKLDGKDPIKEWGLIPTVGQVHPLTPDIRTNTMEIPGMDGAWDFGTEWGSRVFTIPFGVVNHNRNNMQQQLRSFVAFLLDSYGRPREIKLTFDYEPDKYYMVKLNDRIEPERLIFTSEFEVSFVAHKPQANFIVPSNQISWNSDIPIYNSVLWDMGKTEFRITYPQTINLVYSGTKAIRAGYKLVGTGTNVQVSANGKTMIFGDMSNDTFDVNGETYTIKENGEDRLLSTEFIELLYGNNQVKISGSNLNLTFSEQLTYQFI